jgi:predicted O-methyltransferase YrrM
MLRTPEAYAAAFEAERQVEYPVMDALEERYGYKIERDLLERMARVLACPLKHNPPNWQHGRLIYALGRHRLAQGAVTFMLDIGTAKGFSACCMAWALHDAARGELRTLIYSVDIIDPTSNQPRNSVFDGQAENGVSSYTKPFLPPPDHYCAVWAMPGRNELDEQIGFAFIDGAHSYSGVKADIELVVPRQKPGDIILLDDASLPGVRAAIADTLKPRSDYDMEHIDLTAKRSYCIATRVA